MSDASKVRKLGRGLAGLMGTPVAVPLPPQVDQPAAEPKKSDKSDITVQKTTYISAASMPAPGVATAGVSGGGAKAQGKEPSSVLAEPRTPSPASRAKEGADAAPVAVAKSAAAPQSAPAPVAAPTPYVVVRVDEVVANRFQPRREFEPEALAMLAASIKRDGVMQPLVVRKASRDQGIEGSRRVGETGGTPVPPKAKWELVAGERRWRAAQAAGLTHVPAVVVDIPDVTAAMWAVVENVQRVDLGPLEKSHAYARLAKEFGLTQSEISDQVGEDRTLVSHYIRLGELEPSVTALIQAGKITFGHGKVLNSPLVKPGATREKLAARAARETLSVRQLEQLVQRGAGESEEKAESVAWTPQLLPGADDGPFAKVEKIMLESRDDEARWKAEDAAAAAAKRKAESFENRANVRDLEEQIGKHLGTKVKIKTAGNGKRGVVAIEFFSLDHFDGLVQKMGIKRQS